MRYVVFAEDGKIQRTGNVMDFSTALLQARPHERVAVIWNDSLEFIDDSKVTVDPDSLKLLGEGAPDLTLQEIVREAAA